MNTRAGFAGLVAILIVMAIMALGAVYVAKKTLIPAVAPAEDLSPLEQAEEVKRAIEERNLLDSL